MAYEELYWDLFTKYGSIDAYIGYCDCKEDSGSKLENIEDRLGI